MQTNFGKNAHCYTKKIGVSVLKFNLGIKQAISFLCVNDYYTGLGEKRAFLIHKKSYNLTKRKTHLERETERTTITTVSMIVNIYYSGIIYNLVNYITSIGL